MNYSSDEDDQPLVFRRDLKVDKVKCSSQPPKPSKDSDSDDYEPWISKYSNKSSVGSSLTKKVYQNGSASRESQSRNLVSNKRPPDDKRSSVQSSVKKSKLSDSSTPANRKPVPLKAEIKSDDDEDDEEDDDSDDDSEDDDDYEDDDEVPISQRIKKQALSSSKLSSVRQEVVKKNSSSVKQINKRSKKELKTSKYSKPSKVLPGSGEGQKWTSLVHCGVIFPPAYKSHGVKMLYKGKPVDLTPEQEEVATMFAVMIDTDYMNKPKFKENFWDDWSKILGRNHTIQNLDDCDFKPIYEWHQAEKEKKKQISTEEKKALKEEKMKLEEKYMWAIVDGVKEKVGNFRVEPPGLFRGCGEHPKMGKLKKRIHPSDITINIGMDAPIPECPIHGERWKEIMHDNTVTWLAYWNDPINSKEFNYVFLAPSSSLKGQSDQEKYEKARMLKKNVPLHEHGADDAGPSDRPAKRQRVKAPVPTAASPAIRAERCRWLRWDDAYTEQRVMWNNRLAKVQNNRVCAPRVMNWGVLTSLGVLEQVEELLRVRVVEGDVVFETRAWKKALSLCQKVYREMCLEMFCTMRVDDDWSGTEVVTRELVHFRLGGEIHHCTLPRFGVMAGIFRPCEIEQPGFADYMIQGELHHSSTEGFEANAFWQEITGLADRFSSTQSRVASIRDPILRVVHKLLVYSLFHRSTHHDKVYLQELWALWLFQHRDEGRFMNIPWVLACHLEASGAGSRSDSQICGGHFVTQVMKGLEIFSAETARDYSAPIPTQAITLTDLRASRLIDGRTGRLIGMGEAPPKAPPAPRRRADIQSVVAELVQVRDAQRVLMSQMAALLYDARRYQPMLESLAQDRAKVVGRELPEYEPPQIVELGAERVVGDE